LTTFNLIWQITWRSALRILALGALFGGIYGPSVLSILLFTEGLPQGARSAQEFLGLLLNFMLFAAIVGGCFGAVIGFFVGILIGLLIGAVTIRIFRPLYDPSRYLRVIQRLSVLVGVIGTLVGAPLTTGIIFGRMDLGEDLGLLAIFSLVPALLAGLAIRRGSAQVAAWYIRVAMPPAPARRQDARVSS
jgi:hypothetical protein